MDILIWLNSYDAQGNFKSELCQKFHKKLGISDPKEEKKLKKVKKKKEKKEKKQNSFETPKPDKPDTNKDETNVILIFLTFSFL
jgi:hypothetical protein